MTPHDGGSAPLKAGDLALIDYEMWAEGGAAPELIDTTREEVAQSAKIEVPEGTKFEPRPHLVGGDGFPPGVENALLGAAIGKEIAKEFAPAEAFGEKDPKLIELFSMHEIERLPEMRRDDAELAPGTLLTIKGRRGRVVSLTAARVRVDFNPPYAGRKVRVKITPVARITEAVEMARAVIELAYGRGKEFEIKEHQGVLTLKVPERAKFDIAWFASKPRVVDRLRGQLQPKSIHVVEEYATPTPAAPSSAPEAPSGGHAGHSHSTAAKP